MRIGHLEVIHEEQESTGKQNQSGRLEVIPEEQESTPNENESGHLEVIPEEQESTPNQNESGHLEVIPEEQESTPNQNESSKEKTHPLRKEIFQQRSSPENPEEIQKSSHGTQSRKIIPFSLLKAVDAVSATKKMVGKTKMDNKHGERRRSGRFVVTNVPIVAGMSFVFENYADDCWFWETLEMTRKLLLTSSLALIGAEGRNSLGVASILSGKVLTTSFPYLLSTNIN
jgi:hypothetical protein